MAATTGDSVTVPTGGSPVLGLLGPVLDLPAVSGLLGPVLSLPVVSDVVGTVPAILDDLCAPPRAVCDPLDPSLPLPGESPPRVVTSSILGASDCATCPTTPVPGPGGPAPSTPVPAAALTSTGGPAAPPPAAPWAVVSGAQRPAASGVVPLAPAPADRPGRDAPGNGLQAAGSGPGGQDRVAAVTQTADRPVLAGAVPAVTTERIPVGRSVGVPTSPG
jgi:hypothetical protein